MTRMVSWGSINWCLCDGCWILEYVRVLCILLTDYNTTPNVYFRVKKKES